MKEVIVNNQSMNVSQSSILRCIINYNCKCFIVHAPGDLIYNVNRLNDALVSSKLDDLVMHWKSGKSIYATRQMNGLTHVS